MPCTNDVARYHEVRPCCHCHLSGDDFTLERIIEVGLDQYSEVVGDISSAASKELAIEQVTHSSLTVCCSHPMIDCDAVSVLCGATHMH